MKQSINEFLLNIIELGIRIRVENDRLCCQAPKHLLTPILRDQIVERKAEIIEFLQRADFASSSSNELILPVPRDTALPLSFAQQRLWFLQQLEPDNPFYNEHFAIQLKGSVDVAALEQSINGIVQRHEALRTTFEIMEGQPVQIITPNLTLTLPVVDLCQLPEAEQKREVQRLSLEQSQRPFDLVQDSLLLPTLLHLSEQKHVLLLTMHHIIYDSWSGGVFIRELSALYQAFSTGRPASLPELPIQYADFAIWQRQELQGEKLKSQLSYWKQQLENAPPLLQLPTDRPRPPVQTFQGAKQSFLLPKSLTEALKAIAQKAEGTLFMTLLAAFKILLYRYTGQEDIIVGSSIANRNRAEIEGLIGFFVNSLVLRTDISGNPTFEELLGRVRKVTIGAYANQDLPFEKLVEELQPERNLNYNQLFQVLFILQNTPKVNFELPGLTLTPFEVESTRAVLDLRLDITETDSGLEGYWEYSTDLFDAARISRMNSHFQTLLEAIAANPQQRVSEFTLLSEAEQDQLLKEWNHTHTDYPRDKCIHQLFEDQVENTPDAIALIFDSQQLTYQQLNQKANQLAHYLRSLEVGSGVLVGISVEPSLEQVVSLLSVLKAGGVYLPLDPNYPQERLTFMLENSQVQVVLTQEPLLEKISLQKSRIVCLDRDRDAIDRESIENLACTTTPDDLAYAIYTSGSTGKPKAVLGRIRSTLNRLHWMWEMLPFATDEICCQKTSINFVDHVAEIFSPLLKGIPLVIVPDDIRGDIPQLMSLLGDQKITRIVLVPSLLKAMLEYGPEQLKQLQYLKYVFCSGEVLLLNLAQAFQEKISSARLFNLYGSSEVAADVTCFEVNLWQTRQKILEYFKPQVIHLNKENQVPGSEQKPFTKPGVSAETLAANFQQSKLPLYALKVEDYYDQLSQEVLPYVIDTGSPTFIGHMTSALPDFMHDMSKLISRLNQNLVKIETSKSLIFLEREAIAILHRLVYDFADEFYQENIQQKNRNLGIVTTGGTTANISALLCARNRGLLREENSQELSRDSIYQVLSKKGYQDVVLIGSRLMHYSINKATSILGMGTKNVVYIESNSDGQLDIDLLVEKIRECRQKNLYITAMVGIAGTTETGEIDPLVEMGNIAQEFGIHFHVDGAWGGATMFSERHKGKLKGIEKADTITICGHKQLYLPQGISVCLFKDPKMLDFAETTARYQSQRDTFDVGRFTIEGSRSGLSLCLHGALHIIGKRGYEILIDDGIEKAQYFSRLISMLEPFELIMEPTLNIVNYRYIPADLRSKVKQKSLNDDEIQRIDQLNKQIQKEQFEQGITFVSKTTLIDASYGQGKEIVVFRTVLSNPNTTPADLHSVLEDQLRIANQIEIRSKQKLDENIPEKTIDLGDAGQSDLDREMISLQLTDDPKANLEGALEEYLKKNTVPIGKPIANTQIYILDKYGNLVPPGITGELYVGGDGLAKGYLSKPELTEEKFILNPFAKDKTSKNREADRLYKTGDLARWLPDGNIEFVGRIDNQVKIRGFRIELGEIESLLSMYPEIKQAVVIATEDISSNKRLVGYLVTSNQSLTTIQVREFLQQKLPEYMVPSAFVLLETLPLNPNGKIDRKALATLDIDLASSSEYLPPQTPTQEILANIFAGVLGINSVGIHDNFFYLGGHSLLATQVISRIRQSFATEIPLKTLFEFPTVAELDQNLKQLTQNSTQLNIPTIQPIPRNEQPLALSWAQERLWFLNQLEGSSATYNIPGALQVSGNLDINALQLTLSEIVRRHEVLRTSFPTQDGQPIQVINPEVTININIVDLQQLEATEREIVVLQEVQKEAITPFNLEIAPLVRCSLLQLSTTESVLLLTMHHIVSDGWSIGVFIQEISSLYQAFTHGELSPLPELPIQYADFAAWQRQYLSGELLLTQLNYWKQNLADAPELLQLPNDRPRPNVQTYEGTTKSWTIDTELTFKLQNLSRQNGTTLFMTLLAAFATLLYRYSGQSDILIGSPIANRNRSEIESLIGFFVNTLVLRTAFVDDPSFEDLLAQVRETTLKAYQHQDVPFEQVVEALQPQRSLSYSPLFQVMFILQNAPMGEVELPGVNLSLIQSQSTIAKFDLTLSMMETESGLVGGWEYNTDLFDSSTIDRMAGHFRNLLLAVVENPAQKVDELPLLSAAEHHNLLVQWNETAVEYPQDKCLHQLFEEQVEKTPDAVAIEFEGEKLTYQQLNQKANKLAHYLQTLGVGADVKVGICVERSLEMVIGLLGILKAGGAYVPIDPNYPSERIKLMLSDSQASVLLTQKHLAATLPENQANVLCLDSEEIFTNQSSQNSVSNSSENLAYVIYTSGSTGKPKGVQIPHCAVVNFLLSMQQKPGMTKDDILLAVTTISFDIAGLEIYLPLITGAKVVLASRATATDGIELAKQISLSNATVMQGTPATWQLLLASGWQLTQDLKILCGGEALATDLAQELLSKSKSVWNLYGPTEATIWSTVSQIETSQLEKTSIPIGQPIANTQLYILDSNNQPVPIGVPAELHIGGTGLARGYLNRPELTAEKFISFKGNRLYKTGDLARYLPDGNIEYLGRIDNQVKLRGFRIELGEIESVLFNHPQVQQTVVICREDIPGNQQIIAYIVTSEHEFNSTELRPYLQSKLPEYMIPSAFVLLETLPLTPNGKIDRKALPGPDIDLTREHEYVPPQTETEKHIAKVLQEVLQLEKVSIYDNFFELGANSLILVKVNSKLREILSIELPLIDMFGYPNIKTLSQHIAKKVDTPETLLEVPQLEVKQIKSGRKKRRQISKAQY